MPGMMDNVATVNSLIRTLLALVVVGGLGAGGLVAYRAYYEGDRARLDLDQARKDLKETSQKLADAQLELVAKEAKIAQQAADIADLKKTVERQATAMRLLKKDNRLAVIEVLDQAEEDGQLYTTIEWVEVDENNRPIDQPRTFKLKGQTINVDAWVVKFDDKYIEQADLLRGTSICLFKGVFGEFPKPEEVNSLDTPGALPSAYRRGKEVSAFEKRIWDDFWTIANDPKKAEELGIRANHGVVVYNKGVQPGKKYKIELRSTGDLTMRPLGENEPDPTAKPAA